MKKPKHKQKTIDDEIILDPVTFDDDIDLLPEELEEEVEPETTDEITEESFYRFKDNLPMGNDWEG
jgi:hypothetical protein